MPALGACGALVALLVLAPPYTNWFWAVNGFRSVTPAARVALVIVALAAGGLALTRARTGWLAWLAALALSLSLAFPLRERIHFLGDTSARIGALSIFVQNIDVKPLIEWSRQIHANPLDFAINFLGPVALCRLGLGVEQAVSMMSFLLGLAFLTGAWRATARLGAPRELRLALAAALVLTGALEAFAGYSESAGLLLASVAWWWGELLAPLESRTQALRTATAWLIVFLSHRLGIAMLLPQLWRALGPLLKGDRPEARRALLAMSAAMVGGAALVLVAGGQLRQVGLDVRELLSSAHSARNLARPSDVANLLLLTAPFMLLAPIAAGWRSVWTFLRRREAGLVFAALLPLLPLAIQVGASGLGLHRDWDANVMLGWTLTLAAVLICSPLEAPALRGALLACLPVLALGAGAWVAVNANEAAGVKRAEALATGPPALGPSQQGQVMLYLSSWAMYRGRPREAAGYSGKSYELAPTANRGLLAARAWVMAGDLDEASRMIARVRARGGMDSTARASAEILENQIESARGGNRDGR